MSDIRKAIMARLGEFARPGAKAAMAASVRRGIDPKKGGQWINGTWDGGTWSAMVFSEPSEAYGIPEFPHISKLAINPKDKPGIGGVIVNYDRGWDIKPSTPELQKAYREIAQIATAEVNKAVKQGWYSRHGEKEKMANTSSQEVRSRLLQLQGEISNLETKLRSAAKAGDFRLCHGICRVLTATYEKLGAAYLQWDAASKPTTASRPGAKAEMEKWTVVMPSIPDAGTRHFDSWEQAKKYVDSKMGGFTALVSVDGKRYALKHALGQWEKFSRSGAKSTNALSDACWQGYEAVGTKKQDGKTVPNCVPKATAAKPESQDIESEEVKAGLKLMEKADEKVSEKIRTLIKEGKPQDQAVAIALDMKRRGEL